MNKEKVPIKEVHEEPYTALIGIDWANEKHDVWTYETKGGQQTHQVIEHKPDALINWIGEIQRAYPDGRVAICLEQSRGGLIHALLGHEFIHLYPINPATLAKYREAFSPSRAKDDPTDAQLLMELLLKHRDKLKVWKPDDADTRTLRLLNEERRHTVDLRTKLVLRLQAILAGYFPQVMDWVAGNLTSDLACDLLQKWPTLEAIQRAKPQSLRTFYYAHNYRRGDLVEQNIEQIRGAQPLTSDPAILAVSPLAAKTLAKQIHATNVAIRQYDKKIEQAYDQHPDAFIFESFPGAGKVMGPRLLTALGADRDRLEHAIDLQTYSGIAPVTERSGKQEWVHWRWACSAFIRQSFHEFANISCRFSRWANAYYELQRERGNKHHAAIRALAFKWQRIIFRCWKDRKAYDEELYIQALKDSGSPLWARIQAQQNAG